MIAKKSIVVKKQTFAFFPKSVIIISMPQDNQKIIKIIIAVIILAFIFRGLVSLLPFLIILGLIVWGLKQFFSKTKKNMIDQNSPNIKIPSIKNVKSSIKIIGALVIIFIALSVTLTVVPAGNVGVIDFFGKVSGQALSPGINFKIPFSRVIKFSTQTQDYTMTSKIGEGRIKSSDSITALTKEGLKVGLDITVLYHLNKNQAAEIYKTIGKAFEDKIIRPAIRSSIRQIVANYQAEALYSEKREESAKNLLALLKEKIEPRGIVIEDVLLRDVTLPAKLSDAIEEKLKSEQESQRFDFVLEKEEKEAERKRIEARGQRDSQKIINESLTTRYLEYLYIRELKDREGTIYVPVNPNNGLPLFKGL
jgi:regulator of protease activity HflC (stomatin/prohibitin superfamily)